MDKLLKKEEIIKRIEIDKCNSDIKELVNSYVELGLVEGRIDNEGRTILPKEEFYEW